MFMRGGGVCGAASDGTARPMRRPIPCRLRAASITGAVDELLGGSGWLPLPPTLAVLLADGGGTLAAPPAEAAPAPEAPPPPDAAPAPPAAPATAPAAAMAAPPNTATPVATTPPAATRSPPERAGEPPRTAANSLGICQ